jgi:hypothetical protein
MLQPQIGASQDAGETPALPIPHLERRPASGVEPAGRRGTRHTPATNRHAPRRGRDDRAPREHPANPASGGVPESGRCRRLIEPATTGLCRNHVVAASMRARFGARRATGSRAYRQPPRNAPQDAGEDARAPRGDRCQSQGWRCARPRARSPQGDGEPCLWAASPQCAPKMRARTPALPGGDRR